jgi:mono/diheme cytochrome c family protein
VKKYFWAVLVGILGLSFGATRVDIINSLSGLPAASFPSPVVNAHAATKVDLEQIQEIYDRRCAYCHGEDGFTERPNTPSLAEHEFQRSRTNEQLFTAISEGIAPRMPSYGDSLSEEEIRGLVVFIRSLDKKNAKHQQRKNQ